MLSTNESRLILSCCHRCFLWFKFSEDKHWYSFMPSVFIPKRLWFFRRFYWQNVFPRWPPFQYPDQRVKGIMRTSEEIDFRFRLKLKITSVESTYPSQRPECPSLSPHFLLLQQIKDVSQVWHFLTPNSALHSSSFISFKSTRSDCFRK